MAKLPQMKIIEFSSFKILSSISIFFYR